MKKILSLSLVCVIVLMSIPSAFAIVTGGSCFVCGETVSRVCEDCQEYCCAACDPCSYTNWGAGTQVEYDPAADNNGDGLPDHAEYYTVTVPALLSPGSSGNVVAQGTWASNRKLIVMADENVTLTNSINAGDQVVLDIEFLGIELVGSNTVAVSDTEVVSVANIRNALFGTWTGVFEYEVGMFDADVQIGQMGQFTLKDDSCYVEGPNASRYIQMFDYEQGMTWREFVDSAYNVERRIENHYPIAFIINNEGLRLSCPEYDLNVYDENYEEIQPDDYINSNIVYQWAHPE